MKYYAITTKALLLSVLLTTLNFTGISQETGVSPYSRFGLGDLNTKHSPAYLGGAFVSSSSFTNLNTNNPASYSFLKENRPVFEADFSIQFLSLETGGQKSTTRNANITRFALGFPITKKIGIGMGLLPFSTVGYDIKSQEEITGIGKVDYLYSGNGGINKGFLGLAYKIIDKDSIVLSAGINTSFLFGGIEKGKRSEFPDDNTAVNALLRENTKYNGFKYDLGLQYKQKISDNFSFALGTTISTATILKTKKEVINATYDNTFLVERIIDTLSYSQNEKGTVKLPLSMVFGASAILNKKLEISAQYKIEDWSTYKEEYGGISTSDTMQNSTQLSFGVKYTPKNTFEVASILERTQYRVGFRYGNTPLQYNNTALNEFGMSFGLGIPVTRSISSRSNYKSTSTLHVGVEYGSRGTTNNNLIKENYTNIYIGISIMPSRADRWFKRRKIN